MSSSSKNCRHPAQDRMEKLRKNLSKQSKDFDPEEKLQNVQTPGKFIKHLAQLKQKNKAPTKKRQPENKLSDFDVDQIVKGLVKPSEIKAKRETKGCSSKKDLPKPNNVKKEPSVAQTSSSKTSPAQLPRKESPLKKPKAEKIKKQRILEKNLKVINEKLSTSRNVKKSPIKKSRQTDEEPMEFENVLSDQIKTARDAVVSINETMEWDFPNFDRNLPTNSTLNFVVDTNVLIDSLELIKKIKSKRLKGYDVIIIIPWQVLKELDYLKKRESNVSRNARNATNYLLDCLKNSDDGIVGQTCENAQVPVPGFDVEVGDDHLIKCCLQLKFQNCLVFLLSNDNNLSVKSLVMKISVISDKQLGEIVANDKVGDFLPIEQPARSISNPLVLKIQNLISLFKDFLSSISEKYLKNQHGDIWILYSPGKNPCGILQLLDLVQSFPLLFAKTIQENISKLKNFLLKYKDILMITLEKSDILGKCCHYFASSLPYYFSDEVQKFESQAAFYKSKKSDVEESTYSMECCKTTAYYIDIFCSRINTFCFLYSNYTRIPYEPPLPISNIVQNFDFKQKEFHSLKTESALLCFQRISSLQIENINVNTEGIKTLYEILKDYAAENFEPDFSPEDVYEFFIHPHYRLFIPNALQVLNVFSSYLR